MSGNLSYAPRSFEDWAVKFKTLGCEASVKGFRFIAVNQPSI